MNVKAGLSTAFFRSHTFICPRKFPVNTSLCFRKHTQRKEQLSAPSVDTIIQHIRTRTQEWIQDPGEWTHQFFVQASSVLLWEVTSSRPHPLKQYLPQSKPAQYKGCNLQTWSTQPQICYKLMNRTEDWMGSNQNFRLHSERTVTSRDCMELQSNDEIYTNANRKPKITFGQAIWQLQPE